MRDPLHRRRVLSAQRVQAESEKPSSKKSSQEQSKLKRDEYLQYVIERYLQAPDTPDKARRNDWAVAAQFFQRGFALSDIEYAIRLASLRRFLRDPKEPPLDPIRSLAYFRPVINLVRKQQHDPGYIEYIEIKYRMTFKN